MVESFSDEVIATGFQIVEEWTFSDALENGLTVDVKQADEALGVLKYALHKNPEAFPIAYDDIRVAKISERPSDGLPKFRVFFRIGAHSKDVYLLFVDHE